MAIGDVIYMPPYWIYYDLHSALSCYENATYMDYTIAPFGALWKHQKVFTRELSKQHPSFVQFVLPPPRYASQWILLPYRTLQVPETGEWRLIGAFKKLGSYFKKNFNEIDDLIMLLSLSLYKCMLSTGSRQNFIRGRLSSCESLRHGQRGESWIVRCLYCSSHSWREMSRRDRFSCWSKGRLVENRLNWTLFLTLENQDLIAITSESKHG